MPIVIEPRPNTPIQQESLNETGWSGFNTPRSSNVGQTYGPGGMGMRAYMNRPGPMPSNIGRDRMGIMSQPGGYGSDTYNALVGGMNRSQQDRGFDRGKWSSALGRPELAAVDPSDWRSILRILEAGGDPGTETQTAMGPDDDYPMFPSGPGIRPRLKYDPEVQEIDLFDMMDDDTFLPDFDQDEYYSDGWDVSGIMGAMPEERQMAELTEDQMNMMGNPLNTPDFGVSKEDLWNRVKDMEDKGFFGWGAQEPTTQEEYDDYYRQLQEGSVGNWVT